MGRTWYREQNKKDDNKTPPELSVTRMPLKTLNIPPRHTFPCAGGFALYIIFVEYIYDLNTVDLPMISYSKAQKRIEYL